MDDKRKVVVPVAALANAPAGAPETVDRPKNRKSAKAACVHSLIPYLKKFGHLDADRVKRISDATARERRDFYERCIYDLCMVKNDRGQMFKIRRIENFDNRHVQHLVSLWEQRGYSAAALQKYFSFLRTLVSWLGKKGMLKDLADYLSDPNRAKRIRVATHDKGWQAQGVDAEELIARVYNDDPQVGICLLVQRVFGLRPKEGSLLQAAAALQQSITVLYVVKGTKGGRPRVVPIECKDQLEVLRHAATMVNRSTGTLVPDRYRHLSSWFSHFYRVCHRHGIKRSKGLVPYGLRHDYGNDRYEEFAGFPSPVRFGHPLPVDYDKFKDHVARLEVARRMGHSRKDICAAYLGTYNKLRNADSTDTARVLKAPNPQSEEQ